MSKLAEITYVIPKMYATSTVIKAWSVGDTTNNRLSVVETFLALIAKNVLSILLRSFKIVVLEKKERQFIVRVASLHT